jgi:hypothetical protein
MKRVKKGKTKQIGYFDLLRVRAALSSGSKIDQRKKGGRDGDGEEKGK